MHHILLNLFLFLSPLSFPILSTRPLLLQQLLNVLIHPIFSQNTLIHVFRARNLSPALHIPTQTLKRLRHIPLGTRIKERQLVALFQVPVGTNPYLPSLHVEHQAGLAAVVYIDEIAVQFDV
jgi:hypothetical protein